MPLLRVVEPCEVAEAVREDRPVVSAGLLADGNRAPEERFRIVAAPQDPENESVESGASFAERKKQSGRNAIKSRFLYPVVMVSMDYANRSAPGETVTIQISFPDSF